jgi:hypothetical protein
MTFLHLSMSIGRLFQRKRFSHEHLQLSFGIQLDNRG